MESSVDFATLLDAVRKVEVVELAPPGWLNTSIQAYAHRPRDLQDLLAVVPTEQELAFVEKEIPRIAAKEPDRAVMMNAIVGDVRATLAPHNRESAQ